MTAGLTVHLFPVWYQCYFFFSSGNSFDNWGYICGVLMCTEEAFGSKTGKMFTLQFSNLLTSVFEINTCQTLKATTICLWEMALILKNAARHTGLVEMKWEHLIALVMYRLVKSSKYSRKIHSAVLCDFNFQTTAVKIYATLTTSKCVWRNIRKESLQACKQLCEALLWHSGVLS